LRALGAYAVPPMLAALEKNSVNRDVLVYNLARLGDAAVPPIIGAIESPSNRVKSAAAEVMGWLGSEADSIWLWELAFDESQPEGVQISARKSLAKIIFDDAQLAHRIT